jgi:hypothetical protein
MIPNYKRACSLIAKSKETIIEVGMEAATMREAIALSEADSTTAIITSEIHLADMLSATDSDLVETFTGTVFGLELRLLELQLGYCEDEKPIIRTIAGKVGRTVIYASCESDYFYVSSYNHNQQREISK